MSVKDRAPKLGRGLAALLGDVAQTHSAGDHSVSQLSVGSLRPSAYQPRRAIAPEALETLAQSIRASGVLQPILVRPEPDLPDGYEIVAGERRWRAAQIAGLHEVPCLVRRFSDAEALAAALIENLQRQDLNAMEEAEGYQRLSTEHGLKHDEVAQTVGHSRSHIANMIRLLGLPATVQAEVRNGALSAGHARALLAHPDPQRAALQVIAGGLNVRQTEALAQSQSGREAEPRSGDAELTALERDLSEQIGLRVSITVRAKGGSLRIDYGDLDQLDGLISLLDPRRR